MIDVVVLVDDETITRHPSVPAAKNFQQTLQDRLYDEHVPITWEWDPINEQHRGFTDNPPSVVYVKVFQVDS